MCQTPVNDIIFSLFFFMLFGVVCVRAVCSTVVKYLFQMLPFCIHFLAITSALTVLSLDGHLYFVKSMEVWMFHWKACRQNRKIFSMKLWLVIQRAHLTKLRFLILQFVHLYMEESQQNMANLNWIVSRKSVLFGQRQNNSFGKLGLSKICKLLQILHQRLHISHSFCTF